MVNSLRHQSVFSPDEWGDRRIDLIGAGAVGSRLALDLAKLGVRDIHVWDDDVVEAHNVANQIFGLMDIGELKVAALAKLIREQTGTEVTAHAERVESPVNFGEVVFIQVDSMDTRKTIFEESIRYKLNVRLMIETRMGASEGRVYAIDPSNLSHVQGWERRLYTSEQAQASACGGTVSVGPTAAIVAGLALWQFMRWFAVENGSTEDDPEQELIFSLRPTVFLPKVFDI